MIETTVPQNDFEEVFIQVVEVLTERPREWVECRIREIGMDILRCTTKISTMKAVAGIGSVTAREHSRIQQQLKAVLADLHSELAVRKAALNVLKLSSSPHEVPPAGPDLGLADLTDAQLTRKYDHQSGIVSFLSTNFDRERAYLKRIQDAREQRKGGAK